MYLTAPQGKSSLSSVCGVLTHYISPCYFEILLSTPVLPWYYSEVQSVQSFGPFISISTSGLRNKFLEGVQTSNLFLLLKSTLLDFSKISELHRRRQDPFFPISISHILHQHKLHVTSLSYLIPVVAINLKPFEIQSFFSQKWNFFYFN